MDQTYRQRSRRSIDDALAAVRDAAAAEHFGVLHAYDFKQILESKGHPISRECHVLEVCQPRQASQILSHDIAANMMLPCRVSVYEDDGGTWVATVLPTALVAMLGDDPRLAEAAGEVETAMRRIVDAAT